MPAPRLALFFTYRVGLDTWAERGILEREVEPYRRLAPHLGGVTFVTYGAGDATVAAHLDGIEVLSRPRWLGPASMSLLGPWLYRRQLGRADVLKTNQAAGAWTAVIAKRLLRKPLIVRCGYAWSLFARHEMAERWRQRLVRLLEGLAVRAADRVVVTSANTGHYLVATHGLDPSRLRTVPSHVDTGRFAPDAHAPRQSGLVVFVGRLAPQKNLDLLIEAAARVPGTRLVLVGAGPDGPRLAAAARARRVPLELLGSRPNDQLPVILNRADLFVLPSHYEGLPKALLEAMACGLPVVGADVPGIRDAIRHGETGWLVEPEPASLAEAIDLLLADPDLRDRIGRAARAEVECRYSLGAVVERELAVIRELAG